MKIARLAAAALAATLLVAACGDDDDDAAAGGGDAAAYCEVAVELDEQDGPPTDEQLDALAEAAPDAIAEDVRFVVEQFKEQGLDAFIDPEVGERFEATIEPWEQENCPELADDEESDDEEAVAQEPDPDATRVQVIATDFAFEIDGAVPAGKVAFVMQNDGEHPHHMSIIKFQDGTTVADAQEAVEAGLDEVMALMDGEVGESTDAEPRETAVLNADLEPGVYGMGCFVESDGVVHFAEGMRIAFEVA